MLVNAYYVEKEMLPTALKSQQKGLPIGSVTFPDAIIFWNGGLVWNCSFSSQTNNSGLNVYSYGLRAIAVSLGFGSSITQLDGESDIVFQVQNPTVFDELIFSGETRLSNLEERSNEIAEFVVRPNVYAFKVSQEYKLYTPPTYTLGKSLVYLDNPQSIMHYQFGQNDKNFNIDAATITLLNQIGWDLKEPSVANILCNNIGEDGIGSVYESHSFTISDNKAVAYRWRLTLWGKDGQDILLSQGGEAMFTVQPLTAVDSYSRNASGDIEALVSCSYLAENEWIEAKPFRLSLETKPQIIAISEPELIYNDNSPLFYARFTVRYLGAEMLTVAIEEDGDVNLRYFYVEEPVIAHVTTRNMNSHYYNWVDIKVVNSYGVATETLEFEPVESRGALTIQQSTGNGVLKVYNIQGIYLGEYEGDAMQTLPNGIYITKDCLGKTYKRIVQ